MKRWICRVGRNSVFLFHGLILTFTYRGKAELKRFSLSHPALLWICFQSWCLAQCVSSNKKKDVFKLQNLCLNPRDALWPLSSLFCVCVSYLFWLVEWLSFNDCNSSKKNLSSTFKDFWVYHVSYIFIAIKIKKKIVKSNVSSSALCDFSTSAVPYIKCKHNLSAINVNLIHNHNSVISFWNLF